MPEPGFLVGAVAGVLVGAGAEFVIRLSLLLLRRYFYSCNSKQVIFTGTLDNLNFNFILICFKNLKVREFNSYD